MRVIILGNGITGITCARTLRKHSNWDITVISQETKYFWSRTALMYVFMGDMRFEDTKPYEDGFWKKNRIQLVQDEIRSIDFQNSELISGSGKRFTYDKLLIATGAKPNKFGWEGQNLNGVTGMYSYQDLEKIEELSIETKNACIVGGGLIGVELAEMLKTRGTHVTMLIRESGYWRNVLPKVDAELVSNHISTHGIELIFNEELDRILPDENGRVGKVISNTGREIDCQFVGITAGVSPNISFLKNSSLNSNRGVLVNEFLQTSEKNIYAAGDCAEFENPVPGRAKIEQVWYTGRLQGELAAYNMLGAMKKYNPGPWYNSAKFFEVEYQTYGVVLPRPSDQIESFFFQPEREKLVHIQFQRKDQQVMGANFFGIRQRHEVWDSWLREGKTLEFVVHNLALANFDIEFTSTFQKELERQYSNYVTEAAS